MLKVENLCKKYPNFELKDVSFEIPKGYIVGFIGMNGAGKSTTLKSVLNITKPDSGKVTFMGEDISANESEIKNEISLTFGAFDYYSRTKLKKIADVYKRFYKNWNDDVYKNYIRKFNLDEEKKVFELSAGMKVKFALTLALSHDAKLFIFDEPTSGLDPIARDEMLDIFQGIIESGEKSLLFSTHITSDLDKCADYILFIKNGKIVLNLTKDEILESHMLVSGKKDDLTEDFKSRLISYKINSFGFKGLIKNDKLKASDICEREKPNLEDIMIFYNKEKDNEGDII